MSHHPVEIEIDEASAAHEKKEGMQFENPNDMMEEVVNQNLRMSSNIEEDTHLYSSFNSGQRDILGETDIIQTEPNDEEDQEQRNRAQSLSPKKEISINLPKKSFSKISEMEDEEDEDDEVMIR